MYQSSFLTVAHTLRSFKLVIRETGIVAGDPRGMPRKILHAPTLFGLPREIFDKTLILPAKGLLSKHVTYEEKKNNLLFVF